MITRMIDRYQDAHAGYGVGHETDHTGYDGDKQAISRLIEANLSFITAGADLYRTGNIS